MKVNVRDIAREAGVSAATVSNALAGRKGVSEETARLVRETAERMGYARERADRAAREGEPKIRLLMVKKHGLVVINTQFFAEMIEGIERASTAAGYELVVSHVNLERDADAGRRAAALCQGDCAGVLLLATELGKQDLRWFIEATVPIVLLDSLFHGEARDAVVIDNFGAGLQATKYLLSQGHRWIHHITSSVPFHNMRDRRLGYEAAMRRRPGLEEGIWRVTPTLEGAYLDMLAQMDAGRPLPTAFFAANDIIAAGCMRALSERGVPLPDQVSMVGMDDLDLCALLNPALTTLRVYRREMGAMAVRRLLDKLESDARVTFKTMVEVELIERDSVAHRHAEEDQ